MLRFIIGLILLVSAITLSLHDPTRGEPPAADNGLYDFRQLKLLHRSHPAGTERRQEERKRLLQDAEERDRIYGKIESLAEVGPTFVFIYGVHLLQRVRTACLVGETGKIYMYDFRKEGAHAPGMVDGREFSKAVDLAKSLEHIEWRPAPAATLEHADGKNNHELIWYVLLDGRDIPLQLTGDYAGGALPNPQAAELVKLMDGWCPYAQEIRPRPELPGFDGAQPPY